MLILMSVRYLLNVNNLRATIGKVAGSIRPDRLTIAQVSIKDMYQSGSISLPHHDTPHTTSEPNFNVKKPLTSFTVLVLDDFRYLSSVWSHDWWNRQVRPGSKPNRYGDLYCSIRPSLQRAAVGRHGDGRVDSVLLPY
jgi:hypothetical protein